MFYPEHEYKRKSCGPVALIFAGCGCLALVVLVIILVLMFGGIGIFANAVRTSIPDTTYPANTNSTSAASEQIDWRERPRGPEFEELLNRLWGTYDPAIRSGEIYAMLPDGQAVGSVYVNTFRLVLADIRGAVRFGLYGGTIADEADDLLDGKIAYLEELERQLLAGEDLTVPQIEVTQSDGTVFVGNGDNPANNTTTAPLPEPKAPVDAYEFSKSVPYDPGIDGDFREEGELIAAAFNMTVNYSYAEMGQHCTRGKNYVDSVGAFCSATPSVIYIPMDVPDHYPAYLSEPRYLDTIRHEIAHMIIFDKCDSTAPPIAGQERYEGLTNSYAVLYLGASYELLQPSDSSSDYWMDASTDEMAHAVHSGRCA